MIYYLWKNDKGINNILHTALKLTGKIILRNLIQDESEFCR